MKNKLTYILAALVVMSFVNQPALAAKPMKEEARSGHSERERHRDRDRGGVTLFGGPSFGMEFGGRHGGPAFGLRMGDGYESRSYRDRDDECDIKGIYRADGSREYLTPDHPRYHRVRASRWFCTERHAERAGFDPYSW